MMRLLTALLLMFSADAVTLPDVTVRTQSGQSVRLNDWRGKIVVVNLWATWCGPCRSEIAALERLHSEYPHVKVIGIAVDAQGWRTVMPFLRGHGINFPVALLTPDIRMAFPAKSLPQTYVFDAEGRLSATFREALSHADIERIARGKETTNLSAHR